MKFGEDWQQWGPEDINYEKKKNCKKIYYLFANVYGVGCALEGSMQQLLPNKYNMIN